MKKSRFILLVLCFLLLRITTSAMAPQNILSLMRDCAPADSNGLRVHISYRVRHCKMVSGGGGDSRRGFRRDWRKMARPFAD